MERLQAIAEAQVTNLRQQLIEILKKEGRKQSPNIAKDLATASFDEVDRETAERIVRELNSSLGIDIRAGDYDQDGDIAESVKAATASSPMLQSIVNWSFSAFGFMILLTWSVSLVEQEIMRREKIGEIQSNKMENCYFYAESRVPTTSELEKCLEEMKYRKTLRQKLEKL